MARTVSKCLKKNVALFLCFSIHALTLFFLIYGDVTMASTAGILPEATQWRNLDKNTEAYELNKIGETTLQKDPVRKNGISNVFTIPSTNLNKLNILRPSSSPTTLFYLPTTHDQSYKSVTQMPVTTPDIPPYVFFPTTGFPFCEGNVCYFRKLDDTNVNTNKINNRKNDRENTKSQSVNADYFICQGEVCYVNSKGSNNNEQSSVNNFVKSKSSVEKVVCEGNVCLRERVVCDGNTCVRDKMIFDDTNDAPTKTEELNKSNYRRCKKYSCINGICNEVISGNAVYYTTGNNNVHYTNNNNYVIQHTNNNKNNAVHYKSNNNNYGNCVSSIDGRLVYSCNEKKRLNANHSGNTLTHILLHKNRSNNRNGVSKNEGMPKNNHDQRLDESNNSGCASNNANMNNNNMNVKEYAPVTSRLLNLRNSNDFTTTNVNNMNTLRHVDNWNSNLNGHANLYYNGAQYNKSYLQNNRNTNRYLNNLKNVENSDSSTFDFVDGGNKMGYNVFPTNMNELCEYVDNAGNIYFRGCNNAVNMNNSNGSNTLYRNYISNVLKNNGYRINQFQK